MLFYANYGNESEISALANPAIVGALYQLYWSEVEPVQGDFRWGELDAHIERWRAAGKKVALRVMWSSSGYWPDPAAKKPTPQWVWDAGARHALQAATGTEVPLFWDPIYLRHAHDFLDAIAARYDANPDVVFIDATPGAETNPYRLNTIDQADPDFRAVFLQAAASDGTTYSDERWWATLQSYLSSVKRHFATLPVLVTLNRGAVTGSPTRLLEVGDFAVAAGLWVGQNGLNASSYNSPLDHGDAWLRWGTQSRVFFEMGSPTGAEEGTLSEVVEACLRVKCDWLNVYAADVIKGTFGTDTYQADWNSALLRAAASVGL